MSDEQLQHLVKMANQIALNMAAFGDEAVVAEKTADHLRRFWTPAMRDELSEHWRTGADDLSPVVCRALENASRECASG